MGHVRRPRHIPPHVARQTGRHTARQIAARMFRQAFLMALLGGLVAGEALAVTLVSKSAGLEVPNKEEGNTEFELGDINGDGHLDVLSVGDHGSPYVNSNQHGIMVWLGDGAGHWAVHQYGNFGYGGCAIGDLNLDGHADVAWGVHHNWGSSGMDSRLMGAALGDGSGAAWTDWGEGLASNGEEWGMFATALADFDGDGRLDIVSQSFGGSNGLRVYRNQGDGTWVQAYALTGGSVGSTIEAGDVNADGYADVVSTRAGTNVLLGDGAFGFTVAMDGLPGSGIHGIALGDINGDGMQDVSFGYSSSGVRCFTFDGAAWQAASSGLPGSGYYDLTQLGDIDGDGHLDLVAYDPPTGRLFLGDGAGGWSADATWTMPSPGDASALRVDGDIDHDGREDILISASMSGFPFYRNQLRAYSPWEAPPELAARVTSPRGGETLRVGTVRTLRWAAGVPEGEGPATVDLELSLQGAAGPWLPVASGLPNNGRFQWVVDAPAASHSARLRVTVTGASGSAQAVSPGDFRIEGEFSAVGENGSGLGADGEPYHGRSREGQPGWTFRVTPNPTHGRIRLAIEGATEGSAQVSLHDPAGRLMGTTPLPAGTRVWDLGLRETFGRSLDTGQWFVRVQVDGRSVTRPVILLP